MVKDEADIVEGTVRHMADEVDFLLVVDNASTDGTRDLLADLACDTITVQDDPDRAYFQSRKMSVLAEQAAFMGAEWIVPFDADELWVWPRDRISAELSGCRCDIVTADLFNHFATAVDPEKGGPFETIVWRQRKPVDLPKVAFRWRPGAVIHQGNHGVDLPGGAVTTSGPVIHHFPYRSAEQFIRKARNGAAAYRATDLPLSEGAHWRAYGDLLDRHGEDALADVFRTHFWFLSPVDSGMVVDPAPFLRWQT